MPAYAGCHGPNGAGIPNQFPCIGGQHQSYTAAELINFRSGVHKNGQMMTMIFKQMSGDEIKAVAGMMELTQTYSPPANFIKRLSIVDWLFTIALIAASLFALRQYGSHMDFYEEIVLIMEIGALADGLADGVVTVGDCDVRWCSRYGPSEILPQVHSLQSVGNLVDEPAIFPVDAVFLGWPSHAFCFWRLHRLQALLDCGSHGIHRHAGALV